MDDIYRFGQFELDAQRLLLRRNSEALTVEHKPLEVLVELLRNAGDLVTKADLMESVWAGRVVTESVISSCVKKLRAALGDDSQTLILTVHGYGYRFTGQVEHNQPAATATAGEAARTGGALKAGDSPPLRPHWRLKHPLDERGGSWLVEQAKTLEKRVFKFALDAATVTALKRELTIHRLLQRSLGNRGDLVRLLDYNLEAQPYFLELEYCSDGSLVDWLEAQGGVSKVPQPLRLELMAQAAEALAAAHAVGVLHLDIKPSNLLIWAAPDGNPRIRWTDFGSGRLLDPGRLEQLNITRMGMTGAVNPADATTLLYCPPELMAGQSPTTLSDIYALAVMLYQVVLGDLRKPMAPGWEQDIEDEVLRGDLAAAAAGNPANRLHSAAELARRLRQLEPRRAALARQREMDRRTRELQERLDRSRARRPWLIAAGLALSIGLAASQWYYRKALKASGEAQAQAAIAQAVIDFLDNDVLGAASPYLPGNSHELTVREALDRASASLDDRFPGQPLAEAQVRFTIATLDTQLDRLSAAEQQGRKAQSLFAAALGPADPKALGAGMLLGLDLIGESRFAEASQLLQRMQSALDRARQSDAASYLMVWSLKGIYCRFDQRYPEFKSAALQLLEYALKQPAAKSSGLILRRSRLAEAETHLGEFDLADVQDRLIQDDLPKVENPDGSFSALINEEYGMRLYLMRRDDAAVQTLTAAHTGLLRLLGPDDRTTAESLEYLGLAQLRTGHAAEGAQNCRGAYETILRQFGPLSHFTLMAQGHLGIAEFAAQQPSAARQDLNQAADGLEHLLGWAAPSVQYFRYQLIANGGADAVPSAKAQLDPDLLRQAAPAEDWPHLLALLKLPPPGVVGKPG